MIVRGLTQKYYCKRIMSSTMTVCSVGDMVIKPLQRHGMSTDQCDQLHRITDVSTYYTVIHVASYFRINMELLFLASVRVLLFHMILILWNLPDL